MSDVPIWRNPSHVLAGVTRNFDFFLGGGKIKKFCDVILVTFFVKNHNLAKLRNFSSPKLKIKGRWGRRAPNARRFLKIYY